MPMVITGRFGDLARNQGKGALDHGQGLMAGMGRRVVDQFVDDHAARFAQGQRAGIGEGDGDRAIALGGDHVALENLVARMQFRAGAVGVHHFDRAGGLRHRADHDHGFRSAHLGELGGCQRPGQFAGQIGGDGAAFGRDQGGSIGIGEIAGDEDLVAVLAHQHQIGAVALEFGACQETVAGNGQRAGAFAVEHGSREIAAFRRLPSGTRRTGHRCHMHHDRPPLSPCRPSPWNRTLKPIRGL
jgi:hypothetical protein